MAGFSHGSMKRRLVALLAFGTCFCVASPAGAVQAHGGSEGIVSHQIGHLLLLAGMLQMLWMVHQKKYQGGGWSAFRTFLWLLSGWSLFVFLAHALGGGGNPSGHNIVADGARFHNVINRVAEIYVCVIGFEHLILIPALIFLLLALKRWSIQT
ncbi:hypothetical protein KKF84_14985 [Myxococcota bacterium]|nr:hypothetical protein [Myxococcota bacterium]MBU1536629.1 hypothetical protein [Myxococcota bacterium]